MKMDKLWNRCQVCGKLIAYKDFLEGGGASRKLLIPDAYGSEETWGTLCKIHAKVNENG
jgi:hypothetical protein